MDKNALAHFIFEAANETFATMFGLPVTHGESSAECPETVVVSERIFALIGLTGPYNGTGIISCSPQLGCQLSSQMLMTDFQAVNDEVLDVVGELSNMIFGNVKTMLEDKVGLLGLSVPTVVFGLNFRVHSMGEQWIIVPLKVGGHDLDLRLCISQNHSSAMESVIRQPVPSGLD